MLRKYNFMIFTMIFGLLFGLVFFMGYTRTDSAAETGLTKTEPAYSQSESAPSSGACGCSSCSCSSD